MKAVYVVKTYDRESGTLGRAQCIEAEKPEVKAPDDVLIKVAYASICGSDAHYIKDNLFPFEPPFPAGHELSGIIEDLGPAAEEKGFRRGDHVTGNFVLECGLCEACRLGKRQFCSAPAVNGAAQAEYILWKAAQVYKLPPELPLLEASLAEPFVIAVGAMDRAEPKIGQSMFVLGAGSVGQMLIQLSQKSGASLVGASARTLMKRETALAMGADFAVDPKDENLARRVGEETGGRGFDIVFEASGNPECVKQALEIVAPGGTVVVLSYYPPKSVLPIDIYNDIVSKEVSIKGMQVAQNSWVRALRLFPKMNFRPLITSVYPLEECEKAYGELVSGKSLKIVFDCSGGA